jgi:hypothetical protein
MNSPDPSTGNPGEFTMLQLAELVLKLTDSKSRRVFKPLPSDDPRQRRPDLSLGQSGARLVAYHGTRAGPRAHNPVF